MNRLRVRLAYLRQYVWFYLWKWSRPIPWLHVRTIYAVNHARLDYLDTYRRYWPGQTAKEQQ